jgi:lysophospholipase L1-like esterase
MRRPIMLAAAILLWSAGSGPAQAPGVEPSSPLLSNAQVNGLCGRLGELMEAGGVAIPDLQRAAAPVIENTRQNCIQLRLRPARAQITYSLLTNLRAYLALADSVPKPFPFSDAAQQQLTELRTDANRLDAHFRALIESRDRQLTSPDPANLARYADANRKLAAPVPGKPRVVFFGDSITDIWRLNEYFPDSDYLNRGISGQTAGQLIQRMQDDVINLHPAAVLILIGTNDLARETPVTTIESDYEMLAAMASVNKIKLIFASVLPVSDYHKDQDPTYERRLQRPPVFIKALNDWLQAFCTQHGYTYLDYYTAMLDTAGQLPADLSDDGLHPNAKGFRVMAPLASAAIAKTLPPPATSEKPKKRGLASILK